MSSGASSSLRRPDGVIRSDAAQPDRQVAFGRDDEAAGPEADAGRHDRGARHDEVVHTVMMADPPFAPVARAISGWAARPRA